MLCQYEGEKIRVVDYGPAVNITPTVPEVIRKVQV
jgi:hypothetical protein